MKSVNIYGPMQMFLGIAVIILGTHMLVLASIGAISQYYVMLAAVSVFASLMFLMLNFRKMIVRH